MKNEAVLMLPTAPDSNQDITASEVFVLRWENFEDAVSDWAQLLSRSSEEH